MLTFFLVLYNYSRFFFIMSTKITIYSTFLFVHTICCIAYLSSRLYTLTEITSPVKGKKLFFMDL